MKLLGVFLSKLAADVIAIINSRDRLKALLRTPLYSNALYLALANIQNAVFGFVFWIIVARFYSPDDVGLASAAISAASLLAMLSSLGLGYGLIRFLRSSENANNLINSSYTIGGLVSIVAAPIFIIGLGFWSPALVFIRDNPIYLTVFVLFILVSTLSMLTDQTFVGGRRAKFVFVGNLIFNVLRLSLPVALASLLNSFGIFTSWGISLTIALLIGILLFLPRVQPRYHPFFSINLRVVNDIIRFSFANYIGDLFWAAPVFILPIMVVNLVGAESNAYFYIAWTIGSVLTMIPGATSNSLFAEGSYEEERLGQNASRSLKMVFFILVPAVILVSVFADKLLLIFGDLYSQNATDLLRLLAVAALPLGINVIYLSIKRVEKDLRAIIGLTAFVGAVTIGLSCLLLPERGITGAGIAWLVSQSGTALVIIIIWLKGRFSQTT